MKVFIGLSICGFYLLLLRRRGRNGEIMSGALQRSEGEVRKKGGGGGEGGGGGGGDNGHDEVRRRDI